MAIKDGLLKIGSGVQVTVSALTPSRDRGEITAIIPPNDGQGITRDNIVAIAKASMPLVFPGTEMLQRDVSAQVLVGGGALLVARYATASGSRSGYERRSERSPAGYRHMTAYNITEEYVGNIENYVDGKLKPIIVPVPLTTIRWTKSFHSDVRPKDRNYLAGKVNSNPYSIDGYDYAAYTLRFEGQWITHDKYLGSDRWTVMQVVTHDPYAWEDQNVEPDPDDDTKYIFLPNTQRYLETAYFPDMP